MKVVYLVYNFRDQDGFIRTSRLSTIFLSGMNPGPAIKILIKDFNENYSDFANIEYLGVEELDKNIMTVI